LSLATFYRFLAANPELTAVKNPDEEKEVKRFSHQFINELWQTDYPDIFVIPTFRCGM